VTSIVGAFDAIRERLDESDSGITIPLYYQGVSVVLPSKPETFAYVVFENDGSGFGPVSFGGGRGNNRYRNQATLEVFVFTPNRKGIREAMVQAETIAARLRSFRDDDISCFSAHVRPLGEGQRLKPPGLESEVNNYVCALAEITFHFDQIG
jgi:hypothetical protein